MEQTKKKNSMPEACLPIIAYALESFDRYFGGGGDATVGGSEIRRSPVEVGSLILLFTRFNTSQVVQDFFHQQYD